MTYIKNDQYNLFNNIYDRNFVVDFIHIRDALKEMTTTDVLKKILYFQNGCS